MNQSITPLHTDRYEITMLEGALASGLIDAKATFEVFARSLPVGYRYGIVGGTGRLLEALADFRFAADDLAWLQDQGVVSPVLAAYLADYRFTADVHGYLEGEAYTSFSPILRIEGRFADILLETLALSILNFDTGVATKAMRVVRAAEGRRLIEMGTRRTNEDAAVAAARAAYIAGFDTTSNLAAGRLYGIPTAGTSAHAFVLAHRTEREAFAAQVAALGVDTTLLVDTYDIAQGIATGIDVAGTGLGWIRIDSGDLALEAKKARAQMDELGATGTRTMLSGDLDEFAVRDLVAAEAAADGFGIGTKLVAGYMPPGFVYKLVEIEDGADMRPVAKKSTGKVSIGGAKTAYRRMEDGAAVAEVVVPRVLDTEHFAANRRLLTTALVRNGEVVADTSIEAARTRATAAMAELPAEAFDLDIHFPVLHSEIVMQETR